tara:strand:- start:120 stop:350 length:231 start_codon:yes stop_codon:yes gene_type:complete
MYKMNIEKFNPCRYCGDDSDHAGVCCKCEAKHEKERASYELVDHSRVLFDICKAKHEKERASYTEYVKQKQKEKTK